MGCYLAIDKVADWPEMTPSRIDYTESWDVVEFIRIKQLIGEEKARRLLSLFFEEIKEAIARLSRLPADAREHQKIAHNLIAMSGQLGFIKIAKISVELEKASSLDEAWKLHDLLFAAFQEGASAVSALEFGTVGLTS